MTVVSSRNRARLKDIAASANTSIATASQTLNDNGKVAPKTRAPVFRATKKLNCHYLVSPNTAAKARYEKFPETARDVLLGRIRRISEEQEKHPVHLSIILNSNVGSRRIILPIAGYPSQVPFPPEVAQDG